MQSGSMLKKSKKIKKRSVFTCIKSLNWYNLRHNNWVIFSIFLYSKYSFLSKSFIYKFVHAIIFLFIERKAISCLSVELPRIYQYWIYLIILYNRVQLLIKELLIKKSSVCTWKTKLILTELLMSNNATIAYPFWRKLKNQDVADNKQFWRTVKPLLSD